MLNSEQIRELQRRLTNIGYPCGIGGTLNKNTTQAYEKFYTDRHITVPDINTLTDVPDFKNPPNNP